MATEPPEQKEIDRAVLAQQTVTCAHLESSFHKADSLNEYFMYTGIADYFQAELDGYSKVTPETVMQAARKWLPLDRRAELTVIPEKEAEK